MKGLVLLIALFFVISCEHSNKIIEGDLYFSFFRLGSYYYLSDSIIHRLDSIFNSDKNFEIGNSFYEKYNILKKENLLYSPFIELKLENDSVITLYTNNNDYEKIKLNKIKDLQANFKKIRIKANCRYLGYNLYKCNNILELKKIDGQTLMHSRKLKIEDYQ